ncbi:BCCT family transporter [Actinomyces radicidentis]|uniref:BCCT family transporter n=1 Tax=Actinomyces radicidentis TaxID=111015 RepID=UPI000A02C9FD|nr:BCCT family transporter [Actinomyces radicidentis]
MSDPQTPDSQNLHPAPPGEPAPAAEQTSTAASELRDLLVASRDTVASAAPAAEEITYEADNNDAKVDWLVALPAALIALAVVIWGLSSPDSFASVADSALGGLLHGFGWAFVLFTTVFVVFVVIIAVSRFGQIKLGRPDEEPEFSTGSWIAMMFAAGMGIGLMFYGASEPLTFYRDGMPGHQAHEVGTAMAQAMFHWTLHPWAVYAIVGLAIAYSTYRIGRPQLLSAAFTPLVGEKLAKGWLGKIIDIASIVATVFGTACSLGLGALQIGAGLQASGLIDDPSTKVIIGIVLVLTLAYLLSAMSGVGKGIQYLSNANMVIAAVLAVFVFVLGPTVSELNLIPGSIGYYLSEFFEMAGRTAESADGTAGDWLGSWTIFYWAWWISWSPFVGMFIARISRGRSIREFCLTVLFVPAGVSVVWFAIMGGTAITLERAGESIWGDGSAETQLFALLHTMPGGTIAGFVAMVLLATFFITSADSASTVMGSMSQRGRATASPWLSALWGLITAGIGLTLLLSGDGANALNNLQSVTIIAASPFLIILVALMFAIVKGLREDVIYLEYREHQQWQRRLARERRLHREQLEVEALRQRMHPRGPRTPRKGRAPRSEQHAGSHDAGVTDADPAPKG